MNYYRRYLGDHMRDATKPSAVEKEGWRLYELEKRIWIDDHPDATPEEYQQAMRRLAQELGV